VQNTVSMFSTSDANGPFRRFYLGGLSCASLTSAGVPAAAADALGTAGACLPTDQPGGVTIPGPTNPPSLPIP
jgi:hypothetical protein